MDSAASSSAVSALLTDLNQRGWFVNMAEVDRAGDLLVIGECESDTEAEDGTEGPWRLVERIVQVRLSTMDRSQTFAEAEKDARDPRPKPWQSAEIAPEWRTVLVTYGRGANQALHHVDVVEEPTRVVITVHIGTRADFTGGAVPAILILDRVVVDLKDALANRALVDGAR